MHVLMVSTSKEAVDCVFHHINKTKRLSTLNTHYLIVSIELWALLYFEKSQEVKSDADNWKLDYLSLTSCLMCLLPTKKHSCDFS